MSDQNVVSKFFQENQAKFTKKRQASKYLQGFGSIWKKEHNIPMEYSTRTMLEQTPMQKSPKNIKLKKKH